MARTLIDEEEYRAISFVVIDFETTTPTGRRPEPVDVAAIHLKLESNRLTEIRRFAALMRPPEHAPIARFDTDQTGITPEMVADQPPAPDILACLDAGLTDPPYLLVAHNAPTEAGILYDYRAHCPRLAATDFLDTVRLAREVYPDLPSHRLDVLLHHCKIPRPVGRHRALPDVEVTIAVLLRILHDAADRWTSLAQLRAVAGYQAKANKPAQTTLFEL